MPMLKVNGTDLHYHITGKGMPIIFVHPPLLNQEIFNYQRAQLADRFKVVTFDVRGHGQSYYSEAPVTFPLIAEDARQLMDQLDIAQAVICGYSIGGGSVALEAMLTYPDRFVGGILVSAMSENTDWFNQGRVRLASGLSRLKAKRLLTGAVTFRTADMNTTFENLYRGAVNGHIRNIQQYYKAALNYSATSRLDAIRQPTLLVYGQKDTSCHRYAKLLDEHLPVRDLIYINDVGHQIMTKAPRTFSRIATQWMERHFTGRPAQDSRLENFVQDVPDFLPDADTPTAAKSMQEI